MLLRNAEACGLGTPAELKGLKRVFLEPAVRPENATIIRTEIEEADHGLEWVEHADAAEIVLKYGSGHFTDPGCPCEAGRGDVIVWGNSRSRIVLVFNGMKKGIWGKKPAIGFAAAFLEAFRNANPAEQRVR